MNISSFLGLFTVLVLVVLAIAIHLSHKFLDTERLYLSYTAVLDAVLALGTTALPGALSSACAIALVGVSVVLLVSFIWCLRHSRRVLSSPNAQRLLKIDRAMVLLVLYKKNKVSLSKGQCHKINSTINKATNDEKHNAKTNAKFNILLASKKDIKKMIKSI